MYITPAVEEAVFFENIQSFIVMPVESWKSERKRTPPLPFAILFVKLEDFI